MQLGFFVSVPAVVIPIHLLSARFNIISIIGLRFLRCLAGVLTTETLARHPNAKLLSYSHHCRNFKKQIEFREQPPLNQQLHHINLKVVSLILTLPPFALFCCSYSLHWHFLLIINSTSIALYCVTEDDRIFC